jgi:hypothetical protein
MAMANVTLPPAEAAFDSMLRACGETSGPPGTAALAAHQRNHAQADADGSVDFRHKGHHEPSILR